MFTIKNNNLLIDYDDIFFKLRGKADSPGSRCTDLVTVRPDGLATVMDRRKSKGLHRCIRTFTVRAKHPSQITGTGVDWAVDETTPVTFRNSAGDRESSPGPFPSPTRDGRAQPG